MKDNIEMLRNELINWMIGKIITAVELMTSLSIDKIKIAQKISADFNAKLEQEIIDTANKLLPESSNIIFISIIPINYEDILNDKLPIDLYEYLFYQPIDLNQIIAIMECEKLTNNDILVYIEQNKYQCFQDIPYISEVIEFIYNYNYLQYLKHLKDGKPEPLPNKSVNSNISDISEILVIRDIPDIKPIFDPDSILPLYEILKGYFGDEDKQQLLHILKTGDELTIPLLFKSNGNRLTDTFRKMIESNLITCCQKIDLQAWIGKNFIYFSKDIIKEFTEDYLEKCISREYSSCQRPLIEITNGKVQKFEPSDQKNRNKY